MIKKLIKKLIMWIKGLFCRKKTCSKKVLEKVEVKGKMKKKTARKGKK